MAETTTPSGTKALQGAFLILASTLAACVLAGFGWHLGVAAARALGIW